MAEKHEYLHKNNKEKLKQWSAEDFDIEAVIQEINKPIVEVGGPVIGDDEAYSIIPKSVLEDLEQKKIEAGSYISNISTEWHEEVHGCKPHLDFFADARQMPFKDGALSMVFASCLDRDVRKGAIEESYRILTSGGLLIWNGTIQSDLQYAQQAGFEIASYKRSENDSNVTSEDDSNKLSIPRQIIFRKV